MSEATTEKKFYTRIQHRRGTEAEWESNSNFVPLPGELILYTTADLNEITKIKVGDGTNKIADLPFINEPYILPEAGEELGGVKTGGDVTISNGVIAVNDNSHKHTIENITNLESELNDKVDKVSGKGLSTNDFTTAEKNKLADIASGAEVNQNAFSNIVVGTTIITADSETDSLTLVAGNNVTLTPDATNDKVTISATDTTYSAGTGLAMSGTTINHSNSITAKTTYNQSTSSPGYSGTFKVTEPKYDAQGHITGTQVSTITMPPAQTIPTALKNPKALTIGGKTYDGSSAVNISTSDLGLSNALHFIGVVDTLPASSTNGDVVLIGSKEYVYSDGWVELGDGDSHALKTIKVEAGKGLDGGGTLEKNLVINHSTLPTPISNVTEEENKITYIKNMTFDEFGHVTDVTTSDELNSVLSNKWDIANKGIRIPSESNLDSYTTPGTYFSPNASTSATLTGSLPISNAGFSLIVIQGFRLDDLYKYQIAFGGSMFKYRSYNGTTWSDWFDLLGDVTAVTAGDGLTGGGTSGNVTLKVGAGSGITVTADAVGHKNSITAGSVGEAASPSHGGTFSIPKITYDSEGHITEATTVDITLPTGGAEGLTDTQVTQTSVTTNGNFPILLRGTSAGTTTTTTTTSFAKNITINPSTGLLNATSFKGNGYNITNVHAANIVQDTSEYLILDCND